MNPLDSLLPSTMPFGLPLWVFLVGLIVTIILGLWMGYKEYKEWERMQEDAPFPIW